MRFGRENVPKLHYSSFWRLTMKNTLKRLSKMLLAFVLAVAIGTALMLAVYKLPSEPIIDNVARSAGVFLDEGLYPRTSDKDICSALENYTDCLILLEAAYDDDASDLVNAMLNPHFAHKGMFLNDSLYSSYCEPCQDGLEVINCGRYWHGYLIFIKPLLMLTDYSGIRTVICLSQLILLAFVVISFVKKGKAKYLIPVLALYLFLRPLALAKSIQYHDIFFICFAQLPVIVLRNDHYSKREVWPLHFLIIGCLIGYFDYLTYPLIAFGVPMLLLLSLYPDSPMHDLTATIKSSAAWLVGYFGMWASKWLVGSLLTGSNILSEAGESLAFRVSGTIQIDGGISGNLLRYQAIYRNLSAGKYALALCLAVLGISFVYCLVKRRCPSFARLCIYGCFMAAPIAWYAALSNHSWIHTHFTFRTLGLTVFAAFMLALRFLQKESAHDSSCS